MHWQIVLPGTNNLGSTLIFSSRDFLSKIIDRLLKSPVRGAMGLKSAGLVLSLQKREKMLAYAKRGPALNALDILNVCLIVSHYVQFLTLL